MNQSSLDCIFWILFSSYYRVTEETDSIESGWEPADVFARLHRGVSITATDLISAQ